MSKSESLRTEKKRSDARDIDEKIDALSEKDIQALAALFTLLDRWDRQNAEDV
jgi:hypothetical protein